MQSLPNVNEIQPFLSQNSLKMLMLMTTLGATYMFLLRASVLMEPMEPMKITAPSDVMQPQFPFNFTCKHFCFSRNLA